MREKNEYQISSAKLAENNGYLDVMDFLENCASDSIVPACCSEGCEVEPDGVCEHGNPSVLIALGMI